MTRTECHCGAPCCAESVDFLEGPPVTPVRRYGPMVVDGP